MKEALGAAMGAASATGKADTDNTEKYKQLAGVTPQDLAQLLRLDREITRLFEVQMRKRNKNDEMIRNKINDLNDKPSLRNFLFKKVSDQQMQKDIDALEKDVARMYDINKDES